MGASISWCSPSERGHEGSFTELVRRLNKGKVYMELERVVKLRNSNVTGEEPLNYINISLHCDRSLRTKGWISWRLYTALMPPHRSLESKPRYRKIV